MKSHMEVQLFRNSRKSSDYHTRWSCEVSNWYIAERLGWADCRLWQVESAEKFLMTLWLALTFLEFLQVTQHRCAGRKYSSALENA